MSQNDVTVTGTVTKLFDTDASRTYVRIHNKGASPVEIRFNTANTPGFPLASGQVFEPAVVSTEAVFAIATGLVPLSTVLNIVLGKA